MELDLEEEEEEEDDLTSFGSTMNSETSPGSHSCIALALRGGCGASA